MAVSGSELTKQQLIELNIKFVEMEQQQGTVAHDFFATHLSDQLIFRRATGQVVGKCGREGFLEGLDKPSPFLWRESQDISVELSGDRALVTLIIAGKRKDNGSIHLYRNVRLFSHVGENWILEFWYNFELSSS